MKELMDIIVYYNKEGNSARVDWSPRNQSAINIRRKNNGKIKGISPDCPAYLVESRVVDAYTADQMVRVWCRRFNMQGIKSLNYKKDYIELQDFLQSTGYRYNAENKKQKGKFSMKRVQREEKELTELDDRIKFRRDRNGELDGLKFNF